MRVTVRSRDLMFPVIFSVAALLAGPASAQDFRTLEFGAPCDRIPALEAARGSESYEGKLPSGYQLAFRTRELDREALVVYSCDGGKLFRAGYIFDAKDEADATALYSMLKR